MSNPLFRLLPSVDALAAAPPLATLPRPTAVLLAREALAQTRQALSSGQLADPAALQRALAKAVQQRAERLQRPSLRRVWNGVGILLHTNAGRAPLAPAAVAQLHDAAAGYCTLELAADTGKRGQRQDHVRDLLCWLTGAADALVVNNGAAAILLAVHALAWQRPVLVSRGELIEIGGSFRMPDVLVAAGATLVEVGTTNRTHLRDYTTALDRLEREGRPAAAIAVVHRSNFAIVGFESHPELCDLAALAQARGLPLLVDLGSGAMQPLAATLVRPPDGSPPRREPTVSEVLQAGADLVTFSGDKLVGGPQAGIVVGQAALVRQLAASPMARALRVDNLCLAALEATCRLHLLGEADTALPVLAQLHLPLDDLRPQAQALLATCTAQLAGTGLTVRLEAAEARLGGGTDPLVVVPSLALVVQTATPKAAHALAEAALGLPVPILGRVRDAAWWLDVRTLLAGAAGQVPDAVGNQVGAGIFSALHAGASDLLAPAAV